MLRYFYHFIHFLLLFAVPALPLYPQPLVSVRKINLEKNPVKKLDGLSYDEIVHLIDTFESNDWEEQYSFEDLIRIKNFIAFLAKEGALTDQEDLAIDADIAMLLNGEENLIHPALQQDLYEIVPAILIQDMEIVFCKSGWSKIKNFCKKHKTALIIGAAVVVAVAVVVVAVVVTSAGATVAGAAGTAGSAVATDAKKSADAKSPASDTLFTDLQATMHEQISSFKENVAKRDFFQTPLESQMSLEENGRTLGSLFAHDSYNNLQNHIFYNSQLSQEIQDLHEKYTFPSSAENQAAATGHLEIDRKFSTDYSYLYSNTNVTADFNSLSYQVRGEKALTFGYYEQAVQDLGKAIETNPSNPIPYLERGVAHFGLGEYDRSLEDYKQFTSQTQQLNPLSVSEFSVGFTKGLPKGVCESGEGLFLFMADFVKHPVQTSGQIVDSVSTLVDLVRKDEWGVVAEALSPEIYQLATQWDALPSEKRGELAGYALGKHGADILVPGALVKVASKSIKSAQELAAVCKNLQRAQETLVLEAAAEIGSGAKVAEVMRHGQTMAFLGEELGLTAEEIGKLKQAGKLAITIEKEYEHLSATMQESIALHKRAKDALKPYAKQPLPECKVRELIHEMGIPTFPRPKGIPENFLVMVSDKGAGMEYVHPTNPHIRIRVMPGKSHSPFPYQQKPYVVLMKDGKILDKSGNLISRNTLGAHIPLEEFVFIGD